MKLLTLCVGAALCAVVQAQKLPVVDLGYVRQRAYAFNETGNYYNFSNIRYAKAPIGDLRWRAPVAPDTDRKTIDDGSNTVVCPQASTAWINFAEQWIPKYILTKNVTATQAQLNKENSSLTLNNQPPFSSRETEDCLFLDVVVPKPIFDAAGKGSGAPVLVEIYGGGYTEGDKIGVGNPAGLIDRSMYGDNEGLVYVALNYRLGVFGWMAGPSVQSDGVANAGLYDQRFALEWVQKNIHLFGGDPKKVTVMGESAGGGSIMHQVTAYGGLMPGGVPFSQAIIQSPAWLPITSTYTNEVNYVNFAKLVNATSLDQLRDMPSEDLMKANRLQVFQSQYSQFTYGPVVDGYFVPALPGQLLANGHFNKDIKIMLGYNADEGLVFTDPFVQTEDEAVDYIKSAFPLATDTVVQFILQRLYPANSKAYSDPIQRLALSISESIIDCNTYYLEKAFNYTGYSYVFSVSPAIHGQDVAYTFYNGGGTDFASLLLNTTTAVALQDYIVTFATSGTPSTPDVKGVPKFIMYGENRTVQDLGLKNIAETMDELNKFRCNWWQSALYT